MFAGRTSMGVRGINLEKGDKLISLSILRHVEATADERAAYLKQWSAVRRGEDRRGGRAGRREEEGERRDASSVLAALFEMSDADSSSC